MGSLSFSAAITILAQMSVVPVALSYWGQLRYGEWVTITSLITVLRLSDLGFQTYVVNRLNVAFATDDRESFVRILHSALRVQVPMVAVILLLVGTAFTTLPLRDAIGLQTVSQREFALLAWLLTGELLISIPMGVIGGVYRATGRLPRGAMTGATLQASQLTVTLALIAAHGSFALVASARLLVTVLMTCWMLSDLRSLLPWLDFRGAVSRRSVTANWRDGLEMITPGALFLLLPLADALANQLVILVLQRTHGGAMVSLYATHRTVVNAAQLASGLLINAAWPEITRLSVHSAATLRLAQSTLVKFHLWLVAAIALGMLPYLRWIYRSWTVGHMAIDPWTIVLLLARLILWSIWNPSMTTLLATNRHRTAAVIVFAAASVSATIALVTIPTYGMRAAAAALLMGDLFVSAWVIPWVACRVTGHRFAPFVREVATALLMGVMLPTAVGVGVWLVVPSAVLRNWTVLPITGIVAWYGVRTQLTPIERTTITSILPRWMQPVLA